MHRVDLQPKREARPLERMPLIGADDYVDDLLTTPAGACFVRDGRNQAGDAGAVVRITRRADPEGGTPPLEVLLTDAELERVWAALPGWLHRELGTRSAGVATRARAALPRAGAKPRRRRR